MSFDTPEVMHRTSRDTTELIDLKKFQEEYLLVKLPGEILSADDQCTLQYGDNYRQCSQKAVRIDCITFCIPSKIHL